ncbi:hypothetical protein Cni_G09906 [Canna indica]|uniref:Uncharacterized protein n=1 Tax=Canna indica TaxID=4628 RepID=A0AAQ3K3E9_9LILI|nr:hypothetical protein Cni_G09906 [Canna indica]
MAPLCDLSDYRSDICDIHGDIRINGKDFSSVMLIAPSQAQKSKSWRIKPYARKSDPVAMSKVREVTIALRNQDSAAPQCTVTHSVPAVVFSTAGYLGNYFHDFTDVLVPLFQTARQFDGEVQFLVSTYKPWWINKYLPFFKKLSRYEIVNYDDDADVHCFKHAVVGLRSDKDLTIDPSKSAMGYSMADL